MRSEMSTISVTTEHHVYNDVTPDCSEPKQAAERLLKFGTSVSSQSGRPPLCLLFQVTQQTTVGNESDVPRERLEQGTRQRPPALGIRSGPRGPSFLNFFYAERAKGTISQSRSVSGSKMVDIRGLHHTSSCTRSWTPDRRARK